MLNGGREGQEVDLSIPKVLSDQPLPTTTQEDGGDDGEPN
jgi:hypothetical protein